MLSKIATAGQNGQFRTPRHIIKMMVAMTAPTPAGHHLRPGLRHGRLPGRLRRKFAPKTTPNLHRRPAARAFQGGDVPRLRFRQYHAAHRLDEHVIARRGRSADQNRDSLAEDHAGVEEAYTLLLANPPFAGSLDYESTAKDLLQVVKTKKTELLFVALFLRLLKPGGRAAVIVPDGVLFGSSNAHKTLRRTLVEEHRLQAVISMPSGVFKPYAGVSTAVLLFTKTGAGGTERSGSTISGRWLLTG